MIVGGVAIAILISLLISLPTFWTTGIVDGQCGIFLQWPTETDEIIYAVISFIVCYFSSVIVFGYCYGRILFLIRHQLKVFPDVAKTHSTHGNGTQIAGGSSKPNKQRVSVKERKELFIVSEVVSTDQVQRRELEMANDVSSRSADPKQDGGESSTARHGLHAHSDDQNRVVTEMKNRKQMNAIVTMSIISISYLMCWFPMYTCYLLSTFGVKGLNYDVFSNISLVLVIVNICMNPFIYAVRHDAVKKQLVSTFYGSSG